MQSNQIVVAVFVMTGFGLQTVAGTLLSKSFGGDGGASTLAQLNAPAGLAMQSRSNGALGKLYIADTVGAWTILLVIVLPRPPTTSALTDICPHDAGQ